MIGRKGIDMIDKVACILLIFSVLEVKSQEAECATQQSQLKNIAVHEGTVNTLIDFSMNPNSAAWVIYPSTDEFDYAHYIVKKDDTVNPRYTPDFTYGNTYGLTIKNATTRAEPGHEISTAGLYDVSCGAPDPDLRYFAFVVVRQGPTCSCIRVNSESVQLTCSSIYADNIYYPINAMFTLYVDDTNYATDTPARTDYDTSRPIYISTSTFTIDNYSASSTYKCNQTFIGPLNTENLMSSNAPEFNEQCSFVCPPEATTAAPTTTTAAAAATTAAATTEATTAAAATTTVATTTTSTQPPAATTTPGGPPPGDDCTKTRQCQPESGTDNTGIYTQRVVKAQMYTRSDKCCSNNQACGVVVTLQNGSRYLIHDADCNDNSLNMAVVPAYCMSSDWKLVSERRVVLSNVGAFVLAGNIAQIGSIVIPSIQSCNAMMSVL